MKKDDLKEIALGILQYFHESIDSDKEVTLQEAINYIKGSHTVFNDIECEQNSLEKTIEQLKERYREITISGLKSYKNSNENFQKIADTQKKELENISSSNEHIDLGLIKSKFADIQEHMISEVQRANEEIAKLTEKMKLLEEESNVDPLTRVFNRRALEKYLEKVCAKGNLKQELHLLILDIDDFKSINDLYGHLAGDKILIFIANLLTHMLREGDKVFRFGGEEFVIILNRIGDESCKRIATRILKQISTNKLVYKDTTIKVTVSIGATKYQEGDTPESIIERADKALYEAKRDGKNKLVTKSKL